MQTMIIYGTKHGTVEKAVAVLREEMGSNTVVCHVGNEDIPPLEGYDTVIIGGSIYVGKLQNELIQFMNNNLEELLTKKIGLFLCAGHPDPQQVKKEFHDSFPKALYEHAFAKEVFGYEFDFNKMNFVERFMIKRITGINESQFALSEDKIASFAHVMM